MRQVVQVFGSLLILVPFALVQFGYLKPSSKMYIVSNLIGSTVLAVQGGQAGEWGFLLLEGVWALVSLIALCRAVASAIVTNKESVEKQQEAPAE